MVSRDRLWTKDFIFITLENFFLFITFFIFMTTLARYAMDTYAMTPGEAGFAVGVFVIGGLAGRLFSGKYFEVIGRKKFFFTALILNLIVSSGYLLFTGDAGLYAVRFVHGVIYGLLGTAIATLAMDIIPMSRKGAGTGYFTLAVSLHLLREGGLLPEWVLIRKNRHHLNRVNLQGEMMSHVVGRE